MSKSLLYKSITLAAALPRLHLSNQLLPRPIFVAAFTSIPRHQDHCNRFRPINKNMSTISHQQPESKSFIDKLALILINSENKQLVARSKGKSVYYTPGGKREKNETDQQALLRECMEELSVNLFTSTSTETQPITIQHYGTFQAQAYGKPIGTMVRITCYRVLPREAELELEKLVTPSGEIDELEWIGSGFDVSKLTVTGVMILDDLIEKGIVD